MDNTKNDNNHIMGGYRMSDIYIFAMSYEQRSHYQSKYARLVFVCLFVLGILRSCFMYKFSRYN